MAEAAPINIQIDPEALKAQIEEAVATEFNEFAMRLRTAADVLDRGKFWEWRDEEDAKELKREYERGFADGKAAEQNSEGNET